MEVSTFELLFKAQAPKPPATASGTEEIVVDRVVQGYFLAISNLEDQAYEYLVEFTISPPPAGIENQEYRSLAGNTLLFVDTGGSDNTGGFLAGTLASSVFRPSFGNIRIPAKGTALLAVLPSIFENPFDPTLLTETKFEVRGFVSISLPAVPGPQRLSTVAQSGAPVRVLVTPQHRATFIGAMNQLTEQIQATLPTANGGALMSIPPTLGISIIIPPIDIFLPRLELMPPIHDDDRLSVLASMLAQVDADPAQLAALNDLLVQVNVPFEIASV